MKRLALVAVVLILCLSLTACQGKQELSNVSSQTATSDVSASSVPESSSSISSTLEASPSSTESSDAGSSSPTLAESSSVKSSSSVAKPSPAKPSSSAKSSSGKPSSEASAKPSSSAPQAKVTDANSVVLALKKSGLPISDIIVYTAETDDLELLGRPNQYTSRVKFADTRVEQTDNTDPVGGSIEVFANEADAKARYEYINDIVKSGGPMFSQYLYLTGNVFLRVEGVLTPDQAKEYQNAFNTIMK